MSKLTISGIRQIARKNLTKNALNYYESGADYEQTLSENCRAYDRIKLCPHGVGNNRVQNIDLSTHVLGSKLNIPICIAPTAMQRMAHPDGEIATAKGASSSGTFMGVSSWSTTSYQNLSKAVPDSLYIMQLYIYKNKPWTEQLIKQAEKCGFKAIALTVDAPILGQRIADVKEKFNLPSHLSLENFAQFESLQNVSSQNSSGLMEYVSKNIESTLSWNDITWLRSITKLPILVKGIITREDAVECVKRGIEGIIVSNHGGRQLDGVPATIEALPEVVRAVQGKIPVFVDGGIRRGSDVFKALALGAQAVFIGRPVLYGLAYNGTEGVKTVINILTEELKDAMALTGCYTIEDIKPNLVRHETSLGVAPTRQPYKWNWKPSMETTVCMEDIKESAKEKSVVIDDEEEKRITDAFMKFRLRPRRLQGVSNTNSSTKIFGKCLDVPIIMDLTGKQTQCFTEAIEVAKSFQTCVVVSSPPQYGDYFLEVDLTDKDLLSNYLKKQQKSPTRCKGLIANLACTTLQDVTWLTAMSGDIPVVVKGVMSKEVALWCVKQNVNGIVVSLPGKLFDSSLIPNPIDVLPEIVEAINYKVPVFLQGDIRKGTDILKALALGARAVFIDQPIQWGFVHQGKDGIDKVMKILKDELERSMFLAGTAVVNDITSALVVHESYYWDIGNTVASKL